MSAIRKGYTDGPQGQVHWRSVGEAGPAPDLYCLHPAPFSGLAFTGIMPELAAGRRVIAPDFPGHGGSDPLDTEASSERFAEAIEAVIADFGDDRPVDLLGFHTGCLVACEMSVRVKAKIGQMVLIDVPAFEPDARSAHLAEAAEPPGFTSELASLESAWERGITRRIESQGMARSFEMFVEQLRHGEAMNEGFRAGFGYPVEERLAAVTSPAIIIATQSALLQASRRAAVLIPGARLVERLDITRAVLDEAAEIMAAEVLCILNGRQKET